MTIALPVEGRINTGVDRSKIRITISESYPVILRIGKLSFEGKLARLSHVTEKDINDAIEKTLKEVGKTEGEIGEAEALVKKVARDNTFTKEDSERVGKEIRKFIYKQTGCDTIVEIIEHIIGLNDRPVEDFILDTLEGAAKEKAATMILGKLGGPVTQVIEGLMFLSEKYEQDKQKWKNRADAVNANRMLQDFYRRLNNNIEKIAKQRPQGWALTIEFATDSRYFSFFEIPGNLEIWEVFLHLKKFDKGNDINPTGLYTGEVNINIKYEMSKFDEGIQDKYQDWIEGLYKEVDQELGFKWEYKNEGSLTNISRILNTTDAFINVPRWSASDKNLKIPIDFTNVDDYKNIEINRKIERTLDHVYEGIRYQAKSNMTFKTENEEKILYTYEPHYFRLISDGYTGTLPENKVTGEIPWDSSIWESWDGFMELEIIVN